MKLLLCNKCGDIFNLAMVEKKCSCGNAIGVYTDYLNAWYTEGTPKTVIPLCISNPSLRESTVKQALMNKMVPEEYYGVKIDSWVCPANSNTFKKKELDADGSTAR